jgi:uncharacterized protein (DUF111 family)
LGEADDSFQEEEYVVEANIDDMNPEHFEHLMECLLQNGALDVWLQPVQMKKSRPATVVSILSRQSDLAALERILFVESSTLGLRRHAVMRRKLSRRVESVETEWGTVRIKVAGEGNEIFTVSPEYEDCRALAKNASVPLRAVYTAARVAWQNKQQN